MILGEGARRGIDWHVPVGDGQLCTREWKMWVVDMQ